MADSSLRRQCSPQPLQAATDAVVDHVVAELGDYPAQNAGVHVGLERDLPPGPSGEARGQQLALPLVERNGCGHLRDFDATLLVDQAPKDGRDPWHELHAVAAGEDPEEVADR